MHQLPSRKSVCATRKFACTRIAVLLAISSPVTQGSTLTRPWLVQTPNDLRYWPNIMSLWYCLNIICDEITEHAQSSHCIYGFVSFDTFGYYTRIGMGKALGLREKLEKGVQKTSVGPEGHERERERERESESANYWMALNREFYHCVRLSTSYTIYSKGPTSRPN